MYEINTCSPFLDQTSSSQFPTRLVRILLLTVLFLLYMMYLVLNLLLRRSLHTMKGEDNGDKYSKQEVLLKVIGPLLRTGRGSTC